MELFSDNLGVIRVRYDGETQFSLADLHGAKRIRVITYSASEEIIKTVGVSVGEMEVILGHPIPAEKVGRLCAIQNLNFEDLQGKLREDPALIERIRSGKISLYLSRQPCHAKLILVEKEGERYALVGSANFSRNALKGSQMEILLRLDDEDGFALMEKLYDMVKAESDLVRSELIFKKILPHELPLLEKASKQAVVVEVERDVPSIYRFDIVAQRSRAFEALDKTLKPGKNGQIIIDREKLKIVHLSSSPEDNSPKPFCIREEDGALEVLGEKQNFIEEIDEEVREEAQRMVRFMDGYLSGDFLYLEEAEAQVANYWLLWNWFWVAPLMHRLVRKAHQEGRSPHAYPFYALVYGKANTGKTTLLKLLMRSLAGVEVNLLSNSDLSKNVLRGVHASGSELPTIFDDVDPDDVRYKVEPVLKSLYEVPKGTVTPIVLSLNAGQNYAAPDEVRKRAFLVWTGAVLDTAKPQVAHRVHAEAQRILLAQTNKLYRAFLPRLLPMLEREPDWMCASTTCLSNLLKEALDRLPSWATPVNMESISQERFQEMRQKVAGLIKTHRIHWKAGKPTLKLGMDAKRYARELPGWLVEEVQGEVLILKKKGLKRLGLGVKWWPWD